MTSGASSGLSRRHLLFAAAVSAFAAAPPAASAARGDASLLEVLVAYEQETVYAYDVALANAGLGRADTAPLTRLRGEAARAAAALRKVLRREGGTAPPARERGSEKGDPATARETTRAQYLDAIVAAESRTVGGYYVALQAIDDEKLLAGAAAFMAQGGRRLVLLRELAGDPLLARAFETGGL